MSTNTLQLDSYPIKAASTAYADTNIALAKYWGKRDAKLNLPVNSSLSISLKGLGTTTAIECAESDTFTLNNKPHSIGKKRLFSWIDNIFKLHGESQRPALAIKSDNNIPTGAGLASSASAFAAATLALNDLFNWQLSLRELSILARMGSGSASRSLYSGFVIWHKGENCDGSDSFSESIPMYWKELAIAIVTISTEEKAVGSTDGMNRTARTSPLFKSWIEFAQHSCETIHRAILDKDFKTLGECAEHNAMAMHATMHSARPMLNYWKKETLDAIDRLLQLRANGVPVFYTMDAGANLKILFEENNSAHIKKAFPSSIITFPFS